MPNLLRILLATIRFVGVVALGLWVLYLVGACFYDMRLRLPAGVTAALFLGIVVAVVIALPAGQAALVCGGLCALVTAAWLSIPPSNDRDWVPDKAVLAHVEFDGDRFTVRDMRDARYPAMLVSEPEYLDATFDLRGVVGVDLFLCYWGSEYIAHPFLSWRFDDGQTLSISIETRNTKTRPYSTLGGFYRQYELMYVVCTDRDAVLRRTIYEDDGDQVYLYKLMASADEARKLLVSYLASVNALYQSPRWYNTLLNNCTTNIRIHVAATQEQPMPWDLSVFLPGKLDRHLYDRGVVVTTLPFAELKARAHRNPVANHIGRVDDFPRRIREGVPGFGE